MASDVALVQRYCEAGCGELLPLGASARRKYCSQNCNQRMAYQRKRQREDPDYVPREQRHPLRTWENHQEGSTNRVRARRGQQYEEFVRTGYAQQLLENKITASEVAQRIDKSESNISRWMAAYAEDRAKGKLLEHYDRPPEVEEALADFETFCRRYWPDHDVAPFHVEWADLISDALNTGGRLLLLAAQRHTKSETLIKYSVWRICRDPEIKIIWISQSQDLAKKAVGYILDILSNHEELKNEVIGPGGEFKPPSRQNMAWTSEEFTVRTRTKPSKSPTMVAIGKGGSLLSRDADLIVGDDLQEHKHIRSPGVRETDREWFFTDLMSRKQPHTGLAIIGSRQHLDDIYSHILKAPKWTVKVYPVHDPTCTLPEEESDRHDAAGCMLWHEHYPHEYMQEQRAQQGEDYFQRNMMNNPKSDLTQLITARDLERCKDEGRPAGRIPENATRLIAGIDPADSKPVAAVLWAVEPDWGQRGRRHVIDLMEAEPGIRGARAILKLWFEQYGCSLFVVEKNMAQSWWQDAEIRDFTAANGINLKEHYTSASLKWNDTTGVTAMFSRMRTDPPSITIPYQGNETRRKMDRFVRTLLHYDPDFQSNKHADDDLVMAAWFPQPTMDNWSNSHAQQAEVTYRQTSYGFSTAYTASPFARAG